MARFFIAEEDIHDNNVAITGPDVKHITRVLRKKPGDTIELVTGRGMEFTARIGEITNREVTCQVIAAAPVTNESPIRLTLYQGLPKGDKMELVIQKSTELGVARIVPVICERTVVRLDPKKAEERVARWQRVAQEAAKQSRRTGIPEISPPVTFTGAVGELSPDSAAIMPWEQENVVGIRQALEDRRECRKMAVFIGPEGGFSTAEASLAQNCGIRPVSLGPRIMRTETAGIAVVAVVMYELGDLGGSGHV